MPHGLRSSISVWLVAASYFSKLPLTLHPLASDVEDKIEDMTQTACERPIHQRFLVRSLLLLLMLGAAAGVPNLNLWAKMLDKEIKDKNAQKQQHEKGAEQERQKIAELNALVDSEAKQLEKYISQRSTLQAKSQEAEKKIGQLGVLPAAYDQFKNKDIKQLMKMLSKCHTELKKYTHVNKKALDQYVQFTEQCEALNDRKTELDSGSSAIEDLISTLDHKKNEAILRTFKGVSKHFSNVFQELVPTGNASVIMKRRKDLDERAADPANKNSVDDFAGVAIKVSFTGVGENYLMKQLSGGQKSIVALALVFAIQRCDPAPFYLFDEIDAALDPVARGAVAQMIQRQSDPSNESPTQFITTTFKTEMVQTATKHYMVTFQNKVSKIQVVSKATAMASMNAST